MPAPDATAERLNTLYVDELLQSLMPPVHPMVNARQTQAMIHRARDGGPGLCEEPDATTWIWSDLHLGDMASITAFDPVVPDAAGDGPGDDGRLVRAGRRRRHDHLPR